MTKGQTIASIVGAFIVGMGFGSGLKSKPAPPAPVTDIEMKINQAAWDAQQAAHDARKARQAIEWSH